MENLLFLLLGWLLGLCGPLITYILKRPYLKRQLRRSLFIELRDLRFKLAHVVFVIASHNLTLDRQLVEWLKPIFHSDKDAYQSVLKGESLEFMSSLGDAQLREFLRSMPSAGDSLTFKKYRLPFLTANISSLSLFTPEFQRLALDVLSQLEIMHEHIDLTQFSYEKTFDTSLSEDNLHAVHQNLRHTYVVISEQSRRLCDTIGLLLERRR